MNLSLFHVSYLELFKDMNLEINTSGLYYLYGKSGSGKTTFLHLLANIIKNYEGEILLDGKSYKSSQFDEKDFYLNQVGIMFQNSYFIEEYKVNDQLRMLDFPQSKIDEILNRVGLLEYKESKIKYLSLGQHQRLAMCMVYLAHPSIILLDEPTASLDYHNIELLKEIILELSQDSLVIIATHQKEFYFSQCDGVLRIENQQIDLEIMNQKHHFHYSNRKAPFHFKNRWMIYLYHLFYHRKFYLKMMTGLIGMLTLLFILIYVNFSFSHFFLNYQNYFPDLYTLEVENIDSSLLQEISYDYCLPLSYFNCEYNISLANISEGVVYASNDIKEEKLLINNQEWTVDKKIDNSLVNNTVYLSKEDYACLSTNTKEGYVLLFSSLGSLIKARRYLDLKYCATSNTYLDLKENLQSIFHTVNLYLLFLMIYCSVFIVVVIISNQNRVFNRNRKEIILFYLNGMNQRNMILFYLCEIMLYFSMTVILFVGLAPLIVRILQSLCTQYLFQLPLLSDSTVFIEKDWYLLILALSGIIVIVVIAYIYMIHHYLQSSISNLIKEEEGC